MSETRPIPSEQPWWQEFFDETYGQHALARIDPRTTEKAVAFLLDKLGLGEGQTLFDQCCGMGRLSLPIAERGVRVVGVDLSRPYIQRATEEAQRRGLPCSFHCADAFDFVADPPCDAAINWYSSFGYADDDRRNARMLQRALESLNSGGRLAMEQINYAGLLADFRPQMVYRTTGENVGEDADETIILCENELDLAAGLIHSRWTFLLPDGSRWVRHVRPRLYLPHTLASMLEGCGFVDLELFGSADGEPLELSSPRCIILGRRP